MTLFGDDWPHAAPELAPAPSEQEPKTLSGSVEMAGPDRRALYLRWRPSRFEDVVGQEHVTRTLRNAVVHGRLAHAYLFTGPRGTGKTSVARILYRAANCPNSVDGDPCNVCPLCVASLEGRTMDLIEIDAASNRGIDDIRDLRERVGYRPGEGRYRLYIIDEAHELTGTAWDAFLKTLEEPPPHVIFALATTEAHKVPATIISRCQRFDFRRIPFEAIRDQLARVAKDEGIEAEAAVLERLARSARGGLRDGLSLLDQLSSFAGGQVDMGIARAVLGLPAAESVREVLEALGRRDPAQAMAQLIDIVESGVDMRQFAEELVSHMRALLLTRVGAEAPLALEFGVDDLVWLRAQAPAWSTGVLMSAIRDLTNYLVRTRDGHQFQIQLELTLLATCHEAVLAPASPFGSSATNAAQPSPRRVRDEPAVPGTPRSVEVRSRGAPDATHSAELPGGSMPHAASEVPELDEQTAVSAPTGGTTQRKEAPAEQLQEADEEFTAVAEPSTHPAPDGVAEIDVAPPAAASPVRGTALDVEVLRERWPDVVERVSAKKPLLGASLSTAHPVRFEDDRRVIVAFGTRFNCQSAESPTARKLIEEAIAKVLGSPVVLRCVIEDSENGQSTLMDDPVIAFAARTFGGQPKRAPSEERGQDSDA